MTTAKDSSRRRSPAVDHEVVDPVMGGRDEAVRLLLEGETVYAYNPVNFQTELIRLGVSFSSCPMDISSGRPSTPNARLTLSRGAMFRRLPG